MKGIQLTQNKIVMVDDEDFEFLSKFKWHAKKDRYTFYARTNFKYSDGKYRIKSMHRFIMDLQYGDKRQVDHINGNGLDNRKENLRIASHTENMRNRKKLINNTSGYKGIYWNKQKEKWQAQININGIKRLSLGYFSTKEAAALVYNEAAKKYHGKFVRIE